MRALKRPSYELYMRNYTPALVYSQYSGTKPLSGKSFTIEALLAKQDNAAAPQVKYQATAVPSAGLSNPRAVYIYPPHVLQSTIHTQLGCSLHCCQPFTCQMSCHRAFNAQVSKVSLGLHSLIGKNGKSKRMRTSFTSEQLSRLEKEFARQQYMVGSERFLLASALHLTEAQVKVWFQNRRIKWRKQSLEQQQAKLAKLGLAVPLKSPKSQSHPNEGVDNEMDEDDEEYSDDDVDINMSDDSNDHC